VSNLT